MAGGSPLSGVKRRLTGMLRRRTRRRHHVKDYIAVVTNEHGSDFFVFKTRSRSHYLFALMGEGQADTGIYLSIHKRELRPEVAAALANGHGVDTREFVLT
jgi:hypothetical protein